MLLRTYFNFSASLCVKIKEQNLSINAISALDSEVAMHVENKCSFFTPRSVNKINKIRKMNPGLFKILRNIFTK